jgi:NitT/TauT family transport system substrate-binding protein
VLKIMKRKILSCVLAVAMTAVLMTGCGDGGSQTSENSTNDTSVSAETDDIVTASADTGDSDEDESGPIRIVSTFEGTCQVQTQLAYLLGFYDAEGLVEGEDYEFVNANGETGAIMLSTDKADVAIGLISGMLQPLDNGLEAKAILGLHTGCVTLVTLGDSDIESTADLKGKTIGVTALSGSQHIAALRALNFEGYSADDVEFVVYDSDSIQQALLNGAVDVIGLGDYKANIMVAEEGARIIFDTSTDERLKDENCCVLFANNKSIAEKPKKLAKLCTAIQKASIWIEENPELAAQIQAAQGYTVGDVDVNTALLKTYSFPTSQQSLKDAIYRNFDDAKTLGLLKEDTDKDALAESSYIFLDGIADGLDITNIVPPNDPQQFLTVQD